MEYYLCFGLRPYSLWSNASFNLFSTALVLQLGNRFLIIDCIREDQTISPGRPPGPTRPMTQAPRLVLRYTCRAGKCHESKVWMSAREVWEVWMSTRSATLLISTAISLPEFPVPITSTLFPSKPLELRYSQLWKYRPLKLSIPVMKRENHSMSHAWSKTWFSKI